MRFSPKARIFGTSKEEREARLKAFVARHLETVRAAGGAGDRVTYRLLALSAESPSARALRALAPDLKAAGVAIEAILARRASEAALEMADCRFVTDLRLLDAHEQLVLDARTVWVGDCMRRDPDRRDTYEHFSDRCPLTAAHAVRSFAQLWSAAGPSGSLAAGRKWLGPRQPALFDPALLAAADVSPLPAPLRH